MGTSAVEFTYRYPFASELGESAGGAELRLATCSVERRHPQFFDGRVRRPREFAEMLTVLSDVVRTHFWQPRPPMSDPVVTGSEGMLRFEGFSGCCGVYARVDLPADAFDRDIAGRGTTNVDFNAPMRAALARLRNTDDCRLAVGVDEVSLTRGEQSVVEKKVKLPVRWIKGFSEVQAYQPRLSLRMELPAGEARRFLRSLPRSQGLRQTAFVVRQGRSVRLSAREGRNSVQVAGTNRIRVLEPLMRSAKRLRIWADDDAGTSGWEVEFETGRFFLMISPELQRGFSGEGQMLERLAVGSWDEALPRVRDHLAWQSQIDSAEIAMRCGLSEGAVEAALAVLGSRGLAGYDVTTGRYFHRELPFDLDKVEQLQPRLKNARKVLSKESVRLLKRIDSTSFDLLVEGTGVEHHVRLRLEGDKCTCPWFSRYQGQRGPCKHILAARVFVEGAEPAADAIPAQSRQNE